MPRTHTLNVQEHQQDTDYYCGAACAQMVLQTTGAGLLHEDDLYADNHSHSTLDAGVTWATGPDGLQWTMNNRRPPGFSHVFSLYALASEDLISRKIVWSIHNYLIAPIALVYGWAHWIVVRGYTASAHPEDANDNRYTIDSFEINNPWPPAPSFYTPASAPPPLHTDTDGCGTGGNRALADEHITYATWQSTYMTGVPGGLWGGKFVAVCDPEPPAAPGGPRRAAAERKGDGALLAPKRVAEFAVAGLKEHGLYDREGWGQALGQAQPGKGMLVQRLDRSDSYYSMVPFVANQRTVALVAVDGRWGDYRQSVLLPQDQGEHTTISPEEALGLVAGKRIDLGGQRGRMLVREESVSTYPHLVWQPCQESLSPYYPFYMFTTGSHRVYVRVDGKVFTSLTLDQKGI